jgi:hypothetical protein
MSVIERPFLGAEVACWAWYWPSRCCGSMGARAGVCCRLRLRIPGKSYPPPYGLRRGECAGVARGV